MKKVILKSLTLTKWRGERERTIEFHPDETTIKGANGLGKSRIFNAYSWLLFGKDVEDRKDFNVITIANGKELEKVDATVCGVFDVDGQTFTLKRCFVQKWVKPKGQVEEVYKGNETQCYWNDTPVSVKEYTKRVQDIIDSTVFRMVSNPAFFCGMKWQDQREQLFQIAGTISDLDIANGNPEYMALLDRISGKSFADFKRELARRKTQLKTDHAQIQPRIQQTMKLMPDDRDFDDIQSQLDAVNGEIEQLDTAIADKTAAIRQQYEETQRIQSQINDLKTQRQRIVYDVRNKATEAAYEANAKRRELKNLIAMIETSIHEDKRRIATLERSRNEKVQSVERIKSQMNALREEWYGQNAKEWNGETMCPTCGQELPESAIQHSRDLFADAKRKRLNEINENGNRLSSEKDAVEKDIADIEKEIQSLKCGISDKESECGQYTVELNDLPIVDEHPDVNVSEIPEYISLTNKIESLESSIDSGMQPIDTKELNEKRLSRMSMRDNLNSQLADRDLIEKYNQEIEELKVQGKELAQAIADCEREEYMMAQFTKQKIDECERRINSMFTCVTFQLFDHTIDGNEIETCIPLVDGVPYATANTAGRVNAGIDIINTLARHYGICAPIFIDGRESVNDLTDTESQIINLVVSRDKNLVII